MMDIEEDGGREVVSDQAPSARQPRAARRDQTVKSAHVLIGETALRCVVMDMSAAGARIAFASPVSLPSVLALRIRDGSTYPAVRRWSRGLEAGLEFTAPASPSGTEGHARRAQEALEMLRTSGTTGWLGILRAERYFGDEDLRQTAEAIEVAQEQLRLKLRQHASRPPGSP